MCLWRWRGCEARQLRERQGKKNHIFLGNGNYGGKNLIHANNNNRLGQHYPEFHNVKCFTWSKYANQNFTPKKKYKYGHINQMNPYFDNSSGALLFVMFLNWIFWGQSKYKENFALDCQFCYKSISAISVTL